MKNRVNNSLFNKQLVNASFVESFRKLDPRVMIKNPIMFTVEVVTFVMLLLIVWIAVTGNTSQGSLGYNIVIFLVLLATVLFANFAEAIAGIFGGLLAAYSLRLPFYAQAFVAFIGIPAAFALQEFNTKSKVQNPVSEILRILKYSLVTNRRLCYNIMFSGIIGAATLTMAWFVQPVLMKLETPTSYYGVIWTVLNLTVGLSALYSDRVERYFGMRKSNTFILLVIIGGYISLAYNLTYWGLAILFIFYIVRGFATPILKGYINQMTFSEMRATVLSIRNFVIRLIFAAIAPFIGWLNDFYSLHVALLVSAGIIAIPGILFLVLQFRKAD